MLYKVTRTLTFVYNTTSDDYPNMSHEEILDHEYQMEPHLIVDLLQDQDDVDTGVVIIALEEPRIESL